MRSTGISATSHAPNEGSAETRTMTPAFVSMSRARSTAAVRKPTGNCRPTVFALRPRMTSSRRSISSIVAPLETRCKKKLSFARIAKIVGSGSQPPSDLSFLLLPFDLKPPGRWQLHAPLPQGLFRVVDVVLGRRNREDLRARFHPRRRTHGRPERGAHAFGDAVRPSPRGDLVLAEHVVRIQAELEVVRVPRFLGDVAVRRDPRGLEGDVTNLACFRGDQMNLHRELRPRVPDVKLADPDSRHAAHVLLAGVRLATDFAVHAAGLARHLGRRSKWRALFNPSPMRWSRGKTLRAARRVASPALRCFL